MTTKQIKLLENPSNIEVKVNGEITTISYKSPLWPERNCIHQVPGVWELESVSGSDVIIINHDEIIPASRYGNQEY